jgi:hypothetical protein
MTAPSVRYSKKSFCNCRFRDPSFDASVESDFAFGRGWTETQHNQNKGDRDEISEHVQVG